jgi:uncharacterized protein (TIGR02145 family)
MMLHDLRIILISAAISLFAIISCSSDKSSEPSSRVPDVTTANITAITSTSAQCGGTITSDGGEAVTAYGVCWSVNLSPTVNDNKTSDSLDSGNFVSSITGLTAGTKYYIRAYATNSGGCGYGEIDSFTTLSTPTTVTDIDGNVYHTVTIGSQVWLMENLKVTHYRNGDSLSNILDGVAWLAQDSGVYCCYNNNTDLAATYGNLYNWFAIADSRGLAPEGWHVATNAEWQILTDSLGGDTVAGDKLKEAGTSHWDDPNAGTNESGFTALPGGSRSAGGEFMDIGSFGVFWTSTDYSGDFAWMRGLSHENSTVQQGGGYKYYGYSVRCVKD